MDEVNLIVLYFCYWKCHTAEKRQKKEPFFVDNDVNFLLTGAVLRKVKVMSVT